MHPRPIPRPGTAQRAVIVWFGILCCAIANGAVREAWLIPTLGTAAGRLASVALLSAIVIVVARFTMAWIGPASRRGASGVGALWLALTLAFEFGAGHFLFGKPWPELFADYNVARGRLWVVVLLTVVLAPVYSVRRDAGGPR